MQSERTTVESINVSAQNWAQLEAGDRVSVFEPGQEAYEATLNAKMDDSTVIWIDGPGARRAFDFRDGIRVTSQSATSGGIPAPRSRA
jgi:hypothetical protein